MVLDQPRSVGMASLGTDELAVLRVSLDGLDRIMFLPCITALLMIFVRFPTPIEARLADNGL